MINLPLPRSATRDSIVLSRYIAIRTRWVLFCSVTIHGRAVGTLKTLGSSARVVRDHQKGVNDLGRNGVEVRSRACLAHPRDRLEPPMAKADFDSIYTAPDPRPYYRTLGPLDYQIPDHAASIFGRLAHHLHAARDLDRIRIVDLCCSYGVNAALLKTDARFTQLVDHYAAADAEGIDRAALIERDRSFLLERGNGDPFEIIGVDVSAPAINYACEAEILDGGVAEDLEIHEPSPAASALIQPAQLLTVSGGIGYITERTVGRAIDAVAEPPWIAALCLRWIDFEPIANAARDRGLVVHHLADPTFPQRRFTDADEANHVLSELERLDIDPTGRETTGYHHAALFVMHPRDESLPEPLEQLVAGNAN